jgi:tRNA C32,U32 (ribose-2'-O)-methylase TrmJ
MDWALARRGDFILKNSTWFSDLDSAIHDIDLVIGTSGRDVEFERGYARPFVSPFEAIDVVEKWSADKGESFKWALVMGPEDDGLCDQESALCQKLIRIPTSPVNPSLNIAMAAGVVLFSYFERINRSHADSNTGAFLAPERSHSRLAPTEKGRNDWADHKQKESFLNYLMGTIELTQFLKYPDQDSVKARIRRWLQSAPIPLGELLFAFEIVYHLKAWGSGKFEARDFLKKDSNS